jgi:SET domain-containing protein
MIGIGQTAEKGRGVFAWRQIRAGTLIEETPVIVVPAEQLEYLHRTVLRDYYFRWGADDTDAALVLGAFSLCNHSYDPNALFTFHGDRLTISFFARCDIAPGEEITINYHREPDSRAPVDFPVKP